MESTYSNNRDSKSKFNFGIKIQEIIHHQPTSHQAVVHKPVHVHDDTVYHDPHTDVAHVPYEGPPIEQTTVIAPSPLPGLDHTGHLDHSARSITVV